MYPSYACNPRHFPATTFPFCNASLPHASRLSDLVSRLTVEEKVQQLRNGAPAIPRLGIPPYEWWSEGLHGLGSNGPGILFHSQAPGVTTFPQVILSAASFNQTLWYLIAQAVSTEARAMYNVGQAGLTYWSPNINIFRDPRWGRGQETPGEDPVVASHYAVAYVRGLQGEDPKDDDNMEIGGVPKATEDNQSHELKLKVSACCKHFIAYDLEKWQNYSSLTFDAQVNQQDMEDTYLPPFKSCIQDGHASCVMCSYNLINGVPACADQNLLTNLVRKDWSFKGYITSDCDAVANLESFIHYVDTPEDASADALLAGVDLDCGETMSEFTETAIQQGKVNMSNLDQAVSNLFSLRMRLGMFDGDQRALPYGNIEPDVVCSDKHLQLALEAARQSIVLLKNEGDTLPLSTQNVVNIAVIGPSANASKEALLGSYSGIPCRYTTPLQGFQWYADVSYQPGCEDVACESLPDELVNAAKESASQADAVVLVVGLNCSQEREGLDRVSLVLPGKQHELVSEVAASSKGPVILVILTGGPVDISFARDSPKIQSILWAGYPGEAGGRAIAEIIFGEYNPGGRLPMTWYPESFTKVPMTDMNMRPDPSRGYPGRTHRFYMGEKVFDFGYGLSYSKISCSFTAAPDTIILPPQTGPNVGSPGFFSTMDRSFCERLVFEVRIVVRNSGTRGGSHTVLLYAKPPPNKAWGSPLRQLLAFKKVVVEANASVEVSFTIDPCNQLTIATKESGKILHVGTHTLVADDDGAQRSILFTLENSSHQ